MYTYASFAPHALLSGAESFQTGSYFSFNIKDTFLEMPFFKSIEVVVCFRFCSRLSISHVHVIDSVGCIFAMAYKPKQRVLGMHFAR
jgi:hypothetical protein